MAGEGEQRYTIDRVVRMVITAVTVLAGVALLRYLSDVLLPFAAAVVLAYLLNPFVNLFERKTHRRGLAVAITIGGIGLLGTVLVVLLAPLALGQVGRFRESVEKLRDDFSATAAPAVVDDKLPPTASGKAIAGDTSEAKSTIGWRELETGWLEFRRSATGKSRAERLTRLRETMSDTYLGDLLDKAVEYTDSEAFSELLVDAAKSLAVGGWTVVTFALNLVIGLTGVIIVVLYLFFLLLDFPEYSRTWPMFLPPRYREAIVEFLSEFNAAMGRYFRGQSLVALAMALLFTIGFSLIGLPMALPLGLFVGLLNMVPYLQTVGLVPAVLLAALRAVEHDSSFAVSIALTLLVFAVAQIIQDALITPRVMGKATGLKPVAILLGVFVWGKLLGFLGLVLAIPLTCLGIAYYRRYILLHTSETAKTSV